MIGADVEGLIGVNVGGVGGLIGADVGGFTGAIDGLDTVLPQVGADNPTQVLCALLYSN